MQLLKDEETEGTQEEAEARSAGTGPLVFMLKNIAYCTRDFTEMYRELYGLILSRNYVTRSLRSKG